MKRLIAVTLATFTTIGLLSGCAQDNTEDVSRISELEAQVGSLEDSMSALESEKEALAAACEDEKSRLESTLADAESKQEELIGENDKLKEELESLEQKNAELKIPGESIREMIPMEYELEGWYYHALYFTKYDVDSEYNYALSIIREGEDGFERVTVHRDNYFLSGMAISPNGKKLVFTDFEMEGGLATIYMYDIDTGEKRGFSLEEELPRDHDAFSFCWLDDRYLLMAEKLDHGSIARGGDIYVYDTETEQCKVLIETSQYELQLQYFNVLNDELILIKGVLYEETHNFTEDVFFTVKTDRLYELIESGGSMTISPDDAI